MYKHNNEVFLPQVEKNRERNMNFVNPAQRQAVMVQEMPLVHYLLITLPPVARYFIAINKSDRYQIPLCGRKHLPFIIKHINRLRMACH
jgi:hypothetical protein